MKGKKRRELVGFCDSYDIGTPVFAGPEFKQIDYIPLVADQEISIDSIHTNDSNLQKNDTPVAVFDCFSKITSSESSGTN